MLFADANYIYTTSESYLSFAFPKGSNTLKKKINRIFAISLLFALVIAFIALYQQGVDEFGIKGGDIIYDESLLSFDTNWKLVRDGSVISNISVPGFADTGSGKSAVISNTLPASVTGGTYLAFLGADSFVTVYIDGEEVYRSPAIEQRGRLTPLPGWIFVPLKAEYGSGRISLRFDYPYGYSEGILPLILIGNHSEVLLYASYSSYAALYIGISLVVLGILVFIFTMATPSIEGRSQGFAVLGLYMAALGFVLINQANIPRMDNSIYYTEYISSGMVIRILPMLHSIYMYMSLEREKVKKIYLFVFVLSLALFASETLLFLAGVWDLSSSLYLARAFMVLELLLALCFFLKDIFGKSGSPKGKAGRLYSVFTALAITFLVAGECADALGRRFFAGNISNFKYFGALLFAILSSAAVVLMAYRSTLDKLTLANELTKNRVSLMISQIQPHFVCNTLNAIMAMMKSAPDKAYSTISDFSRYLRYNINALSSVELIPFSEELKHIRVYLDIEKERFRERVEIVYDISDDDFAVPPLSVQPFVENAVKHGVCQKSEGGTVRVSSAEERDAYVVTIEDNGVGFDTSLIETGKRGVGIKNAMYRLRALADADTKIESEIGKGTKVTITFPKDRRTSLDENYNS